MLDAEKPLLDRPTRPFHYQMSRPPVAGTSGRQLRRYYDIAGITIEVNADLPLTDETFRSKFQKFEVAGPGDDTISISHHFTLPEAFIERPGPLLYDRQPWRIHQSDEGLLYTCVTPGSQGVEVRQAALVSPGYRRTHMYHADDGNFRRGDNDSLSLFATDQVLIAPLLAPRHGCYLHAAGVIMSGRGLLFAGHSGAGKSTMVTMLRHRAEILCDDRVIVRQHDQGFRIHGTWSHGDIPEVSSASAPLGAILFLRQATENRLEPLSDPKRIAPELLDRLIKPFVTSEWWEMTLPTIEELASRVPCYELHFDRSGGVVELIEDLLRALPSAPIHASTTAYSPVLARSTPLP